MPLFKRRMVIWGALFVIVVTASGMAKVGVGQCVADELILRKAGLAFIKKVADINTDAYNITCDYRPLPESAASYLWPGHTYAVVKFHLTNEESQLTISVEFLDGKFNSYRLSLVRGSPFLNSGEYADPVHVAKQALERYQLIFEVSHCCQLASLLDELVHSGSKVVESGEAVLEALPSGALRWCYKRNNILAPKKCFLIGVNKGGFLELFSDDWRFYTIDNTKINVSRQEAIEIALDHVRDCIDELGATIAKCEASSTLYNSADTGRGDCLTLFPAWNIEFQFDKTYRQGLVGYSVLIWADTGEAWEAEPQGYYASIIPRENASAGLSPLFFLLAVILLGALMSTFSIRKARKR